MLERAADTERCDRVLRQVEQRPALELDAAAVGMVESAQTVEERRLAGAVGTDEAADLTGGDLEGDVVQRDDAAEANRQAADAEERLAVGCGALAHRPAGRKRHRLARPSRRDAPDSKLNLPRTPFLWRSYCR